MIQLHDNQRIDVERIRSAYRTGAKRVLLVRPTGSGKTVIFSYVTANATQKMQQTLILAHRVELLEQISAALNKFNVPHGFIAAGYPYHRDRPVHVASVQTLVRRLDQVPVPTFIVCDEAHHMVSGNTWGKVIGQYPAARVLGVTATPRRASGEGLGQVFDSMVLGPSVRELIDQGFLSDFKIYGPPTVDTSGLHVRAGEFIQQEVSRVMDKPSVFGDAIAHYRKLADGKPAVVFCYSVDHSRATAKAFRDAGYKFEHIDGGTDNDIRKAIVGDFKERRIQGLCSCDLISEGFDAPGIEVGILLRPTASEGLYLQQVGRCLRISAGKHSSIVIDHVGNATRHGLPDEDRDWSLEGKEKRAKKQAGLSVRVCPNCFAAQSSLRRTCVECKAEFPIEAREVAEIEGELVEIQRREARRSQGQAQTLEALIEIGKQRGYANPHFWAKRVFEGRRKHG